MLYTWKNCIVVTQQTFQHHFNIVFRLIWRHNVVQCQINVETTLCTSMLKFKTLSNVQINIVYLNIDLNNVRQHRNNVVIFTMSKQCWKYYPLKKKKKKLKPQVKNKIIYLSFKEYVRLKIFFILFTILRGICKRIFAELQRFLKHQIYWNSKTIFKPSHFVTVMSVNVNWFLTSQEG